MIMGMSLPNILRKLAAAIGLLAAAACPTLEAGNRYAVLVGVNHYQDEAALEPLKYAASDAKSLADVLCRRGYEAHRIETLTTGGEVPTRERILNALKNVVKHPLLQPDDSVVFMFAGHGFNSNGESYICPSDFDAKHPESSGISVAEVAELLAAAPAGAKCVMLDACRNEVVSEANSEFNLLTGLKKMQLSAGADSQGIMFFSSCLAGQQSYEDPQLERGVFMNFVIEGIAGKADHSGNFDGSVSAFELIDYTSRKTYDFVLPKYDARQRPWFDSHSTSDICIAEIPSEDRLVLEKELGSVTRVSPLQQLQRQQAEEDLYDALALLAGGNYDLALKRATGSIDRDGENYMARRLRALVYMLMGNKNQQAAHDYYGKAVDDMLAVSSQLRIVVPQTQSPLAIMDGSNTLAELNAGDVILVKKIEKFGNHHWLLVTGVDRIEEGESSRFVSIAALHGKPGGYVQLAPLAIPEASAAQMTNAAMSKQLYKQGLGLSSGTAASQPLQKIQRGINTYNTVSTIVNEATGGRASMPTIPSLPIPSYAKQFLRFP
jgi:hypothetical protein